MTQQPDLAVEEIAAAKLNLALHVIGRRDDGYHLLDTLVTFAAEGDRLSLALSPTLALPLAPAPADGFHLTGRFAASLQGEADNLVTRARDGLRRLRQARGLPAPGVEITLDKRLPVASGLGGGSADAAAALRGLERLWGRLPGSGPVEPAALARLALSLGADVPMCLASRPLRAEGIGDRITPIDSLPRFGLVIANPLQPVSTPAIFRALTRRDHPPIGTLPDRRDPALWLALLAAARNDLEAPARGLCPAIAAVSRAIADTGARLTRMSGSGASVFGLYDDAAAAQDAADRLAAQWPDWYVMASTTL